MLISFISGIIISLITAEYFLSGIFLILFAAVVGIICSTYYIAKHRKPNNNLKPFIVFAGCVFGILLHLTYSAIFYSPAAAYAGETSYISGSIASEPDKDGTRVVVNVQSIDNNRIRFPFKAILYLDEQISAVPGDEISVYASLRKPNTYENFDAYRHYKSRGIYLTAVAQDYAKLSEPDNYPLWAKLLHIADDISNRIHDIMPSEHSAALITALTLGNSRDLSREFYDAITDIGISHTVSVSGMHVSFISGLMLLLFGFTIGPYLAIPVLILFTLIAGAPVAAVRALIMQMIMLISIIIKREPNAKISLFFALGIILIINPFAICDISLWLSFTSTLGLILYSNPIRAALIKPFSKLKHETLLKPINAIMSPLAMTFAALFLSTPVLIIVFRRISIISPAANLLLLFPLELLFFGGLILTFISYIYLPFAQLLGNVLEWIYKYIEYMVYSLSEFPYANYSAESIYMISLFICIYIMICIYLFLKHHQKDKFTLKFRYIIAACILCISTTVFCEWYDKSHSSYAAVFDTQGAQCALIHDDTNAVLINCGGYDMSYDVPAYLDSVMLDKADLLIITDYKSGSIKYVPSLLSVLDVDKIIMPPAENEQEAEKLKEISEYNAEIEFITESRCINTGDIEIYIGAYDGKLFVRSEADALSLLAPGSLPPETLGRALYDIGYPHTLIVSTGIYYSTHDLPGSVHMLGPSAVIMSQFYPMSESKLSESAGNIPIVIDGTLSGTTVFRSTDTGRVSISHTQSRHLQ